MPVSDKPEVLPNVLLVEDNSVLRDSTAALLKSRGLQVRACGSAEEAQALVWEKMPDVAIIDLLMPHTCGAVLLGELAKLPGFEKVKVVVTTALSDPLPPLPAGVKVLKKPFEIQELMALIGG